MSSRFFIGNLAPDATEHGLRDFFVARGLAVSQVSIVLDRGTGRSRGFAFVEFGGAAEADAAIETLGDASIDGRNLIVRHVDEREPASSHRSRARKEEP